MVPAQDLGLLGGSWDVGKGLRKGPPRLELELWRGQTGEAEATAEMGPVPDKQPQAETTIREREEIPWLLLISLPPVSSQRLPLAEPDRKPAGEEPGKCSFLGAAAVIQSRAGEGRQSRQVSTHVPTGNHRGSLVSLQEYLYF